MKFFELTFIVEDSQEERLAALAKRFGKVNGWGEKDILQFAVAAVHKAEIEAKLDFLENVIEGMEKVQLINVNRKMKNIFS